MKKILQTLKPYTGMIIGCLLLVFLSSMSELFLPYLMKMMLSEGITGSATGVITDLPIILTYGGAMLGVTILGSVLTIAASFLSSKISAAFARDLRRDLYHKVINYSELEEGKIGTASLITRSTNDVMQIQNFAVMFLRFLVKVPIMLVGGTIMSFVTDWKLSLVVLVAMPIILVCVLLVTKFVIPLFSESQKRVDRLTLVARENIAGIRVIRAFGGERHEQQRFEKSNRDVMDINVKAQRIMALLYPIMQLLMSLTSIAIVIIAVLMSNNSVASGSADFGIIANLMSVSQYVMQILMSVVFAAMIFVMLPRAKVSANRINEVLSSETNIVWGTDDAPITGGEVEFRDVTFKFDGAENPTLNNLSFTAPVGTTTAIVGSTGSGKSTLINLLPRLFDATEGQILIDGRDTREMSEKTLADAIAFVPQKAVLLSGTIKDNILYGATDKSDENLKKSAAIADCTDFVYNKEDGFNSVVEQNGRNFSGGQKQRLSIARAIAKRAKILIFDDSFSALDFKTDKKVREKIKSATKDATVFIVAQRIGSIMNCDNILVLENGRLVAAGRHEDLLKTSPVYRDIALSQLSEKELGVN